MCGERILPGELRAIPDGSSPRVRGTPESEPAYPVTRRFIPACAGNASPESSSRLGNRVHPRVCGERAKAGRRSEKVCGSSPRVRGTPGPAQRPRRVPQVHPRVCGERTSRQNTTGRDHGSSPRVRGTRRPACRAKRCSRFIPACAGNAARSPGRRGHTTVHPRVCGERTWSP